MEVLETGHTGCAWKNNVKSNRLDLRIRRQLKSYFGAIRLS